LGVYQVANLIFPVLISPFLISKIGLGNFGIITSAQALMTFFNIVCDYGFNMSATKDISILRDDSKGINAIISSVLTIKLLLFLLSFIINIIIVLSVATFSKYSIIYIFSFAITLGRAFFPVWFFQGMQKMYYLIIYSVFSKGIAAILILFLVKSQSDSAIVNPIIGGMDFLGTLLLFIILVSKYNFKFSIPKKSELLSQTKKGFFLFISNFFANISVSSNLLILGFYTGTTNLGIFSVVDKIVSIIKQLPIIFFQAVYPQACRLWVQSKDEFIFFIKRISILLFLCLLAAATITSLLSFKISHFFSNSYNIEISTLLKWMCFLPVIAGLNIPAYIVVLITEKTVISSRITIVAALINIILNVILSNKFGYFGTLVAIATYDTIVTIAHNYIILSNRLKIFLTHQFKNT
jgi:PST family polysaccharide transporter